MDKAKKSMENYLKQKERDREEKEQYEIAVRKEHQLYKGNGAYLSLLKNSNSELIDLGPNWRTSASARSSEILLGENRMDMRFYNFCDFTVTTANRFGIVTPLAPMSIRSDACDHLLLIDNYRGAGIYIEIKIEVNGWTATEMMSYYRSLEIMPSGGYVLKNNRLYKDIKDAIESSWVSYKHPAKRRTPSTYGKDNVGIMTHRFLFYIPQERFNFARIFYDQDLDITFSSENMAPATYHPYFKDEENEISFIIGKELQRRKSLETIVFVSNKRKTLYRRVGCEILSIPSQISDDIEREGIRIYGSYLDENDKITVRPKFIDLDDEDTMVRYGFFLSLDEARNFGKDIELIKMKNKLTEKELDFKVEQQKLNEALMLEENRHKETMMQLKLLEAQLKLQETKESNIDKKDERTYKKDERRSNQVYRRIDRIYQLEDQDFKYRDKVIEAETRKIAAENARLETEAKSFARGSDNTARNFTNAAAIITGVAAITATVVKVASTNTTSSFISGALISSAASVPIIPVTAAAVAVGVCLYGIGKIFDWLL